MLNVKLVIAGLPRAAPGAGLVYDAVAARAGVVGAQIHEVPQRRRLLPASREPRAASRTAETQAASTISPSWTLSSS
ncbi:hypothetical protein PG985_016452 [Apiospora marii]|uniref:uncharacterized protein n=1 Tax=Apiospora marii TaxID=335849 RepID=UPI00312E574D